MTPNTTIPAGLWDRDVTRFEFDPPVILGGRDSVTELGAELAEHGIDSAVVVCNPSVADTPEAIDPVIEHMGDRFAGLFSSATSTKRLRDAWRAAQEVRDLNAESIVAVGAGSALDIATVATTLVDTDRSFTDIVEYFLEHGRIPLDQNPRPLVAIPTTLAGAELSQGAGINVEVPGGDGEVVSGGVSDPQLRPRAVFYDPELVSHTPKSILRGSAMNGFNKGIESIYSPGATPITDATASRGLRLLLNSLPSLAEDDLETDTIEMILEGSMLVQYGTSRPGVTNLSVIHAFGHGVTAVSPVQQGIAHAVITPHVLHHLLEQEPCRPNVFVDIFEVDEPDEVIEQVLILRDSLDLPTRFSEIDALDREMLPAIADATATDALIDNLPNGISLSYQDITRLLETAW